MVTREDCGMAPRGQRTQSVIEIGKDGHRPAPISPSGGTEYNTSTDQKGSDESLPSAACPAYCKYSALVCRNKPAINGISVPHHTRPGVHHFAFPVREGEVHLPHVDALAGHLAVLVLQVPYDEAAQALLGGTPGVL